MSVFFRFYRVDLMRATDRTPTLENVVMASFKVSITLVVETIVAYVDGQLKSVASVTGWLRLKLEPGHVLVLWVNIRLCT